jgi:hypothetical protein
MNTFLRLLAASLAAGAITLVFGIAPSGAARAGNSVTYQDSSGEDPASLDIQQIVVSNDDAGLLTFAIHLGNVASLAGKNDAAIFIDATNNANDGAGPNFDGAELVLDISGGSIDVGRWNGSKFDFSGGSPSSLNFSFASGILTVKVNANDLALTSFNFWVATDTDYSSDTSHIDAAPDPGHGTYAYQVKITPPAAASSPKPVTKAPAKKAVPKCKKAQKSTNAHPCHR